MTYETENKYFLNNAYIKVSITGLSTEVKPTQIEGKPLWNGSTYFAIDTSKVYMWSMQDQQWYEL